MIETLNCNTGDFRVSNTEVSGESGKIIETLQESISKMGDTYKTAFGYIATGDTVKARKVLYSLVSPLKAMNLLLDEQGLA